MMLWIQYDFSMISKKVDLVTELKQFIHFSASRIESTAQKMKFSMIPIQDGLFWGCSRMAQLYLTERKPKKYMNHRKLANFAISRNADIDCILIHNFQFL